MSQSDNVQEVLLPFEPSLEEKAFLFQQVQELEAVATQFGSLTILVEERHPDNDPSDLSYEVTFVVAPENLDFRIQATGKNLYSTCMAAKEEAKARLSQLINQVPDQALAAARADSIKIPPELLH